jgi:hypothetical protein
MKSLIAAVIILGTVTAGTHTYAATSQARVDIKGTDSAVALTPGTAEGGQISNAGWIPDPEKKKQILVTIFPASTDWKQATFSFTPSKDGSVTLILRGAWNADGTQTWTWYDDIQATGTEIKNADFESGNDGSWTLFDDKYRKASISDITKTGKGSVKVSQAFTATQNVAVKANVPVTITFWYKTEGAN